MELIRGELGKLGIGFSPKLHFDRLVPADRTLWYAWPIASREGVLMDLMRKLDREGRSFLLA